MDMEEETVSTDKEHEEDIKPKRWKRSMITKTMYLQVTSTWAGYRQRKESCRWEKDISASQSGWGDGRFKCHVAKSDEEFWNSKNKSMSQAISIMI